MTGYGGTPMTCPNGHPVAFAGQRFCEVCRVAIGAPPVSPAPGAAAPQSPPPAYTPPAAFAPPAAFVPPTAASQPTMPYATQPVAPQPVGAGPAVRGGRRSGPLLLGLVAALVVVGGGAAFVLVAHPFGGGGASPVPVAGGAAAGTASPAAVRTASPALTATAAGSTSTPDAPIATPEPPGPGNTFNDVPSFPAARPKRLTAPLTDDVGALGSGGATAQSAMDRLLKEDHVQLWVWFTDTLSGTAGVDFASNTAKLNGFGGNDLLLVVAMTDHEYGFSKPDGIAISATEVGTMLSKTLEGALQAGNPGQGVADFADALRAALGGTGTAAPTSCPASAPTAWGASDSATVTLLTSKGAIVIAVKGSLAPNATAEFVALAQCHYYDSVVFHMLKPDQFIVGGDGQFGRTPNVDTSQVGDGGPGYTIPIDKNTTTYKRGTVAMLPTGDTAPNMPVSQFFVVLSDYEAKLDTKDNLWPIIGEVTSGMDVANAIAVMPNSGDPDFLPIDPLPIISATVTRP